jgi:Tfp pilus assembly protein PilZ
MQDDGQESRRRHRRVGGAFPVRISTIEAERDPWTGRNYFRASQETCVNVSRGGAFVRTAELLEAGRRVLLELQLPNGSQIEAIGRVAWTRRAISAGTPQPDTGVGVEFLGGASDQLAALDDYLSRLAEVPSDDLDH